MIEMNVEQEVKTEDAELIVRFLGKDENFGHKITANGIATGLKGAERNIFNRKAKMILLLLSAICKEIFGYERVAMATFFWIKTDKATFKNWFKEWFGKELEEV